MKSWSSTWVAVAALFTSIASCSSAVEDKQSDPGARLPLHPVSGEPALLTLRTTDYGIHLVQPGRRLGEFVAVWPDGTILWSPEFEQDGVRCLAAEIPPEQIRLAVEALRKLIDDPARTRRNFLAPDETFDSVILFDGRCTSSMESSAHYWEDSPTAVATDLGIVAVEGGDRDALVRSRSAEFVKFLDTWTRCVSQVHGLRPTEGTPTSFPKEGWWNCRTGQCRVIEYVR